MSNLYFKLIIGNNFTHKTMHQRLYYVTHTYTRYSHESTGSM